MKMNITKARPINRLPASVRRSLYLGHVQSYLFHGLRVLWDEIGSAFEVGPKVMNVANFGAQMISGLNRWAGPTCVFAGIKESPVCASVEKNPKYLVRK